MLRKLYLIWMIRTVTHCLHRIRAYDGEELLNGYYLELSDHEWPTEKPKEGINQ